MCFFVKYGSNLAIRDQNILCVFCSGNTSVIWNSPSLPWFKANPPPSPEVLSGPALPLLKVAPGAAAPSQGLSLLCHQWLQSERQPANFSGVVEELFQLIPDEALYMDASPERCRTCAVVGNSGNLKGSHYGRLIDSSDFIIRSVFPRFWQKCEHAVFFTELWRQDCGFLRASWRESNRKMGKKMEFWSFYLSSVLESDPHL